MRLVLKRDREDRQSFGFIRSDPSSKIFCERSIEFWPERSLDQTSRSLHPSGRAPRTAHQLQLRIDREGALECGDLLRAVDVDRKVRESRIRLASRTIVVAVMRS